MLDTGWEISQHHCYRHCLYVPGLYNFTVVTAMLDIGRDNWRHQSRGFNEYLLYMQRVLRLDVNMVVYIDAKGKPMVEWMRRGREARTRIIESKIEDVPYYKYR